MKILFDLEADGFLDTITKIHCVAYTDLEKNDGITTVLVDMDDIRTLFETATCVVGHSIVGYDLPALRKVLGITYTGEIIDTLPLSWYLYPTRNKSFGLDAFGQDFGIEKPKIDDWSSLTIEEYSHRCSEDVRINKALYDDLEAKLTHLYYMDQEGKDRVTQYLTFKMQLAAKQAEQGWDFDKTRAIALRDELQRLKSERYEMLADAMPLNIKFDYKTKPKICHKKDGSLSAHGEAWMSFLKENGLPDTWDEPVQYVKSREVGNPDSPVQIKDWLFSLGWVPQTFVFTRNTKGEEKKIPQVRTSDKELCPSVIKLVERDETINLLDGYSVVTHRLAIVNNFLDHERDGKLTARVHGLTNTFRFKHIAPLVNLPGVDKPWGEEIRGLLKAPANKLLCGADMVSLEDTTKRHYMTPLDPEYCSEMEKEGWDPHLDLAKFAGAVTHEQIALGGPDVKAIRKNYKAANYACVYGVGAQTLSRATGLNETEAGKLITAYWDRNWAVKEVAKGIKVRRIQRGNTTLMWIQNPISGFWHNLRNEKDIWSTINQSSGVYCFDRWVHHLTQRSFWPICQFHDEVILVAPFEKTLAEELKYDLEQAMVDTNAELKLNVTLGIDAQFGTNYAHIH